MVRGTKVNRRAIKLLSSLLLTQRDGGCTIRASQKTDVNLITVTSPVVSLILYKLTLYVV